MAEVHRTTLTPGKLELLTDWLPGQPWFLGGAPDLTRAGGFRLDDPAGEVGLEVLIVADSSGDYVVPLSYRDAPLAGAEDALIGTSEHGVLGTRWIYDGTRDPVFVAQLSALVDGQSVAQSQSRSFTPDPSVTSQPRDGDATVEVVRVPTLNGDLPAGGGWVQAGWTRADGSAVRAVIAQASQAPQP